MDKIRALEKLRDVMRVKHLSLVTERTYGHWLGRFWDAAMAMPKEWPREQKLERFLSDLALGECAASTQNQAFHAILFFFREVIKQPLANVDALRAKRPAMIRHAPSVDDTRRLLAAVEDVAGYPTRLIVRMLYGCGLRVGEPLALRVRDVQIDHSRLIIRQAKGAKDRMVQIPCSLARELQAQLKGSRALYEHDQLSGLPCKLPGLMGKKAASYERSWAWYWLFPQRSACADPRTGRMVRWHLHPSNVQRAVKLAANRIGLDGAITPHHLRHAYATHALAQGANIRSLQEALGHAHLDTTMGYLCADAMAVRSPLDLLSC